MLSLFTVMFSIFSLLIYSSKSYAEETKCYFPDIPSFFEGKTLPNGQPADLSFADYRTLNPKGAALLLNCAKTLYKNADLSQFNDASRKRLNRTMDTTWQLHNTAATAQKDGYIALGGNSDIGGANDLGTMIIDSHKKLVAIGLLFNTRDRIDENEKNNYFYANFLFIYDSSDFVDKKFIAINEMDSILNIINENTYGTFVFGNKYFLGSSLRL
ncbi:hypothetical protein [Asaia prunellae]|uniref:hypothetical protein n=1 Tax=Asaia prunellae TaxID=610245 RepID=UPI0011DD5E3A|nr:hypothetical protein [Asaia prunellae]